MKYTNNLNLPPALARFLARDTYSRGSANISVTGLIEPPRKQALYEAHNEELTEDVSDRVYAAMGTVIHKMIEDEARPEEDGAIAEKRFYMRVPGPLGEWTVSGGMDNIDLIGLGDGTVRIEDWKTAKTDEMLVGVKWEREAQLNIYRVLLEANGYKVGALRDYFLLRDHSKVRAGQQSTRVSLHSSGGSSDSPYPEHPVVVHDIRLWSMEEAVAYIMERVATHQNAQAQYAYLLASDDISPQTALPECTDDERWADPPRFAVTVPGAAQATRVLDSMAEAEAYVAEHTSGFDYTVEEAKGKFKVFKANSIRASKTFDTRIEADLWVQEQGRTYDILPRPSLAIRCRWYCVVAQICEQARANGDAE